MLLTFPLQVSFNKGKVGVPQQRRVSAAALSAIVILIRESWPQPSSSDPLICNRSELAGADELTSKTQPDSLTPLSRQLLFDPPSHASALPQEPCGKAHGTEKNVAINYNCELNTVEEVFPYMESDRIYIEETEFFF